MTTPEPLHAECTPIPGISRARDEEHALIVIDANRPTAPPVLLTINDLYPAVAPAASVLVADWGRGMPDTAARRARPGTDRRPGQPWIRLLKQPQRDI